MDNAGTKSERSGDFFHMIPRRSVVVFNIAVFFVFAPVGLLFVSSLEPERPWLPVLVNIVVSGLIAVSWAATFTVSRWFIVGIVFFTLATFSLNTVLQDTPIGIGSGAPSVVSIGLIAAIVTGYVLFVTFISGQGRTTVRLMTEMSIARNIHDMLVPPVSFTNDRIEVLGFSSPSTEMGGDLIDVVDHGETTDLFLADVSGHGVRAGVVMGMVKSAIRMGLRKDENLSGLLRDLNEVLESTTSPELYLTLVGLRIDRPGRVEYALAGHHHITHYRASASEPRRLGGRSFPLGMFDGRTYGTETAALEPGDLLAVYTDGLNETTDASDEELGHEAIERTVTALAARPLPEIRQAVFDLVEQHGEQTDDRTLLLVRFR